jgi:hypothetical protein
MGVPNDPAQIAAGLREGKAPQPAAAPQDPDEVLTPEKHRLSSLPVTAYRPLRTMNNLNETFVLDLAGGHMQGVFKPASGEKDAGRNGVRPGTYYRREVAASQVADLLGMGDLVPPTVFRTRNGEPGSLQQFVPDAATANEVQDNYGSEYDGATDAARAALFDYIIGHNDRHHYNWMLSGQSDFDSPGKLVLIDNGISFPVLMHHDDWDNSAFWANAAYQGLPMPDVSQMLGKWPRIERALLGAGIEPRAIELTRRRFEEATSGRYQQIDELPLDFTPPYSNKGRLSIRQFLSS